MLHITECYNTVAIMMVSCCHLPTSGFVMLFTPFNTFQTNTFQCILVTDGFTSYVIFLYADDLIQWTTGAASGGIDGLGGTEAQVGFNAGDRATSINHPFSQTPEVLNLSEARVPYHVMTDGMLIYRVDGEVAVQNGKLL